MIVVPDARSIAAMPIRGEKNQRTINLDVPAPGIRNNHTVPYGADPLIATSLAMNCQATFMESLRDKICQPKAANR